MNIETKLEIFDIYISVQKMIVYGLIKSQNDYYRVRGCLI